MADLPDKISSGAFGRDPQRKTIKLELIKRADGNYDAFDKTTGKFYRTVSNAEAANVIYYNQRYNQRRKEELKEKRAAKAAQKKPDVNKTPKVKPETTEKPGTSKGLGKPKKKVKAETPDIPEKPPAPKENSIVDREAQAKEAQAKAEKAEAKAKALQQKAWETQKNNALKWSEGQTPEVRKQTLAYIEKVNKGELTPRQFDQWQSKTINRIKGQTANMNKPAGDAAKPAADTAKPAAESKAPEGQPKTTNKAGYTVYETAKEAKAATPEAKPATKSPGLVQEAKNLGKATKKGLGKLLDNPVGKYIRNNKIQTGAVGIAGGVPLIERALEVKKDMAGGQSFTEALNKPDSNTKLARGQVNALLAGLGAKGGGALFARVGAPVIGTTIGAAALPYLGNKAMDAMGILKGPEAPAQSPAESQPTPVNQGRDWSPGELDSLMGTEPQVEELKQRQQDAVDRVPETILEEERQAAQAADQASSSMGPSSKPPGMYNEPPSGIRDILSPENPDENFNRLLQMQDYARSNPAANLRKKRIMQAGLDAVETGTFRARRPDRYSIVV